MFLGILGQAFFGNTFFKTRADCVPNRIQCSIPNVGRAIKHQDCTQSFFCVCATHFFVLRKKGSKMKERMKEEEIEKGACGPPTRKVFF